MQLYEMTKPELERYRELCNFTPDELIFFNSRAKHKSHIQIATDNYWSESKVDKLAHNVRLKISRI